MPQTLLAFTFLIFAALVPPGLAQTAVPQPDRNGDYFSNQSSVSGRVVTPLSPGSLWQVVSLGLNCRSSAGINHAIVHQFEQGQLLQADVGRGGSDEVLWNATDTNGNPWMWVRSPSGESYDCYVRANHNYIQPYIGR